MDNYDQFRSLHGANKKMEVKIWGIVQGPISIEDVDDSELDDAPPDSKYFMVCKSEIDGVMGEDNFWFEELEDAYELQKHFSKNIDPITIDLGYHPRYN